MNLFSRIFKRRDAPIESKAEREARHADLFSALDKLNDASRAAQSLRAVAALSAQEILKTNDGAAMAFALGAVDPSYEYPPHVLADMQRLRLADESGYVSPETRRACADALPT